MSPWWPLLGLLSWCLIFQSSHCNSFEDWAPVDIGRLVQERRNSSALAMELRLSCTNPSISSMCAQSSNEVLRVEYMIAYQCDSSSNVPCVTCLIEAAMAGFCPSFGLFWYVYKEAIWNTLRLRQNGCYPPNDIFRCIFNPRPLRPKGYCRHLRLSVCPSVRLSVCLFPSSLLTQ